MKIIECKTSSTDPNYVTVKTINLKYNKNLLKEYDFKISINATSSETQSYLELVSESYKNIKENIKEEGITISIKEEDFFEFNLKNDLEKTEYVELPNRIKSYKYNQDIEEVTKELEEEGYICN